MFKNIQQQLQEGLNTSNLNLLSTRVNMCVRPAMPMPVNPPQAQQLQHKAHWVLMCLLVETFPSTSPRQRCTPQCHAVLQPLYCCAGPKTVCGCYWHCWSQSRKNTKILCCECMGGNLHSEREEGWHQNIHLMPDIKMCDTQWCGQVQKCQRKDKQRKEGQGGRSRAEGGIAVHSFLALAWS